MAGEWIKMRTNLWSDPRVSLMCDLTNNTEATVIGGLYWLWAAADEHTEDGFMPGLSAPAIDRKTRIKGFGQALCKAGWIQISDEGITIERFDEHNGASAKSRAGTAKRVAKHSAKSKNTENTNGELTLDLENANGASVSLPLAREEKRRDKEEVEQTQVQKQPQHQPLPDDLPVAAPKPKKVKAPKPTEPGTGKAWAAYANAYLLRYSVEPVRNAMVNGQLSTLVKRIGAADAEHVAGFYVGHRHRYYVEKMHPVGLLLADCEKLRTEWATSTQMTAARAQQQDRTQTNLDAFAPLIAEAEAREQAEREAHHASE